MTDLHEESASDEGLRRVLVELRETLASARERYDELVRFRATEGARVELSSDPRLSLEPLHFERRGLRPGKRLAKPPAPGQSVVEDFFDDAGRWIATCEHTTEYGYYEEFFERAGPVVSGSRFDYYAADKKPINVSRATFDNGLIVDYALRGHRGWWYEKYGRDNDGRVRSIENSGFSPEHGDKPTASVFLVRYAQDGGVEAIRQRWASGEEELVYPS